MSDKRVKICPSCFQYNHTDSLRCATCGGSLAGVVSQIPTQTSELGAPSPIVPTSDIPSMHLSQAEAPISSVKPSPSGPLSNNIGQNTDVIDPPVVPSSSLYTPWSQSSPPDHGQRGRRRVLLPILIGVTVIAVIVWRLLVSGPILRPTNPNPNVLYQLGEFNASNGQLLGINDGSFAPFLLGPDGQLKEQAVAQLKQKHVNQAISLWSAALHITNNDAEAWIYLENQSIFLSELPYITLVVGTNLFEPLGSDLSALRGIYIAQHEFNSGNHGFKLRILIANSGTDTTNVSVITQQIVNIAKQDKTIVGVISWLTSNENIIALPNLSGAHIPMISPLAASDRLTNASPYFLRIIPPNQIQGKQGALFVERTLHARKVVIFVDNNDSYSQNVAQDFEDQFRKDGNTILKIEPFITDKTSKIKSLIRDALETTPDLLFFTSRDVSDVANFQDALPTSGPFAKLPALAGGAGYVIHEAGYGRWYFNADAFPDELNNVASNLSSQPPFYQDYSNAFNEDDLKPAGYYGYTRPDSYAMLSYDVTSVFLKAVQVVIANNKITLTTDGLQHITPTILAQTLPHIALQGVSGWIAFDSTGNPINKALVFLAVSPDGHTYMKDWLGCFTQTICRNAS